ncbi:PEP-CTERM sorting domain-containing protein [Pseudorhodoferax sp. LjRoot39]|uniref:PEP-CTERM sorting domain-containing protein n=1 Tax=Pseudorhodoferax sp. LjRoot39 TaxID=3342328 RepID=UPI003ECC68AE
MKRIAIALALSAGVLGAQAAIVGWQFKGLTEHEFNPEGISEIVPFALYIEMDTAAIANGTAGYAQNGSWFRWRVGGNQAVAACESAWGGSISGFRTSGAGFYMESLYPSNDCAVTINFFGLAKGLEVAADPLTNWYDTSSFAAEITLYGNHSFRAISVTYAAQMIPEPSPVALIGAGLAGLFWVRRRKDTRAQA